MSTTQQVLEIYDEIEEEDLDAECLIGLMQIGEDGRLEIVAADPDRISFLDQVAQRMNGKPAVSVHSEEAPSQPFELPITTLWRGDPRFKEALLVYIQDHYGLRMH